jgi:hypothetical protein
MRSTRTRLVCHALRIAKAAPACGVPVSANVMFSDDIERIRRSRQTRNRIVIAFLAVGLAIAFLVGYSPDPPRPYLAVLGLACVLKLNLDYLFDLPMGIGAPAAMPSERRARKGVLIGSWVMLLFMVYGLVAW